jgi:hypothetical protein
MLSPFNAVHLVLHALPAELSFESLIQNKGKSLLFPHTVCFELNYHSTMQTDKYLYMTLRYEMQLQSHDLKSSVHIFLDTTIIMPKILQTV